MTDPKFCECDDPGKCDCGGLIPFTGRADPSGLLLDRWAGCGLCNQTGRMQLKDWLRVTGHFILMHAIVFMVGYLLGARGWKPW